MQFKTSQQLSIKLLIIYMISSFVFLSSIELHIHTQQATDDHGLAVAFSSLSNDISGVDNTDEITVSPEAMLKVHNSTPDMFAVFLLLALIIAVSTHVSILHRRDSQPCSPLPFYGTPSLRAPPQ